MLSPPTVLIGTDDDLALGEFGIATRMTQRPGAKQPEGLPVGEPARTMVYKPPTGTSPDEVGPQPRKPLRWSPARAATRSRSGGR
jgi:hypothetical protein